MTDTTPLLKKDLHNAVYGDGPRAFEWKDKPHRLLICAGEEIDRLRGALDKIARRYPCATAEDMARVAKETLGNGN